MASKSLLCGGFFRINVCYSLRLRRNGDIHPIRYPWVPLCLPAFAFRQTAPMVIVICSALSGTELYYMFVISPVPTWVLLSHISRLYQCYYYWPISRTFLIRVCWTSMIFYFPVIHPRDDHGNFESSKWRLLIYTIIIHLSISGAAHRYICRKHNLYQFEGAEHRDIIS